MQTARRLLIVIALAAGAVSCGDVARSSRSPSLLIIDSLAAARGNTPGTFGGNLLSDVLTMVTSPDPCTAKTPCPTIFNDIGQAKLRFTMKDPGPPGQPTLPSDLNAVTIDRYHVEYVRSDGRSAPGVDVPYPFDAAVTGTIAVGNQVTLGFELVRVTAKEESPLVQLITVPNVLSTIAKVTFYGHDQAGNDLSVTGMIQVDFGNFADQ